MPPNQAPFTLAPMMQAAPDSTFLGAMQRARGMFPKQGALPGVAPAQNSPVNPGVPLPAGDPAYVPGGQGPMAGGAAMQQPGLLQRMWGSLAPGGGQPMPGVQPQTMPMMPPDMGASNGW